MNKKGCEITYKGTVLSVEKQARNPTEQFKKIETLMLVNYVMKLIAY